MGFSIFLVRYRLKIIVIPAKAGIQSFKARASCGYWIPAFAGMTNIAGRNLFRTVVGFRRNDKNFELITEPENALGACGVPENSLMFLHIQTLT